MATVQFRFRFLRKPSLSESQAWKEGPEGRAGTTGAGPSLPKGSLQDSRRRRGVARRNARDPAADKGPQGKLSGLPQRVQEYDQRSLMGARESSASKVALLDHDISTTLK